MGVGDFPVKPIGKPLPRPAGRPGGQNGDRPRGRPGDRPQGRPAMNAGARPDRKPAARPAVRRPSSRPAVTIPALPADPLAAVKEAWQPVVRWCKKEMREANYMEPKIRAAVEQFQTFVKGVMAAADAAQFNEAQNQAAGYVREHAFLRWAPLPSPLPRPETT
ncbi:MAG TPA: hypothetical protein VD902_01940 [Symbiobacteriaceae bacterium]|nr:hypothetical protein [Symbiobacteriaceae bacterium]